MTNRLGAETSPYLRQHKDNPVDWYAWGSDAFAEAERRNVPVLLSVGYSACHWCHVMAHECFEDDETASIMNSLFVNVKVDREERPDIDSIYMDAVQAMTGRGGWPMTVFLTPAGEPFYGGTYFPKPTFIQLMNAITDAWINKRSDIDNNVAALMEAVGRTALVGPSADLVGPELLDDSANALIAAFDPTWGGFGGAPKFPSTMNLDFLLRRYVSQPSDELRRVIETSLDAMASGGMYDHLGGGFARYSVDAQWLVPHFEKMLYDQALLARIYLRAGLSCREPRWLQIATETIDFVLDELRHPRGGLFSALDADSLDEHGHSHEGLYYTWTPREVHDCLGTEAGKDACAWYGISDTGNFEGRSIPNRMHARGRFDRPSEIESSRRILLEVRAKRPKPGLDDKVITEWNAMMLPRSPKQRLLSTTHVGWTPRCHSVTFSSQNSAMRMVHGIAAGTRTAPREHATSRSPMTSHRSQTASSRCTRQRVLRASSAQHARQPTSSSPTIGMRASAAYSRPPPTPNVSSPDRRT
ncbi:MAG: hypothetical protein RIS71_816 [Actinomycetota bacterium]